MYITALKSISPQCTYDGSFFEGKYVSHSGNKYFVEEPNYMGMIAPNLLRRMGKCLRMGIGTAMPLLLNEEKVDAIIIGSADGEMDDGMKFLNQIVDYDEGTLSPTNFIQSTPNAIAGNIAILTANSCYNSTYVHKGNAFENTLLDAFLLMEENKANRVLVGNVEEISDFNFNIETLAGQYKKDDTTSESLISSETDGTVSGEGACMFILQKQAESYYAQILDVDQTSFPEQKYLLEKINSFLKRNNLKPSDIDVLVLGRNGDARYDYWYNIVAQSLFAQIKSFNFKNFVGDYPTCVSFGLYLSVQAMNGKKIPTWDAFPEDVKHVLIYNQYKGEQHGFILLKK